jgi:hypothetical protein
MAVLTNVRLFRGISVFFASLYLTLSVLSVVFMNMYPDNTIYNEITVIDNRIPVSPIILVLIGSFVSLMYHVTACIMAQTFVESTLYQHRLIPAHYMELFVVDGLYLIVYMILVRFEYAESFAFALAVHGACIGFMYHKIVYLARALALALGAIITFRGYLNFEDRHYRQCTLIFIAGYVGFCMIFLAEYLHQRALRRETEVQDQKEEEDDDAGVQEIDLQDQQQQQPPMTMEEASKQIDHEVHTYRKSCVFDGALSLCSAIFRLCCVFLVGRTVVRNISIVEMRADF